MVVGYIVLVSNRVVYTYVNIRMYIHTYVHVHNNIITQNVDRAKFSKLLFRCLDGKL